MQEKCFYMRLSPQDTQACRKERLLLKVSIQFGSASMNEKLRRRGCGGPEVQVPASEEK